MIDIAKIRREDIRWHLLQAINLSRPVGIYTEPLLVIVRSVYPDATHQEVRLNLDYLEEREMVRITKDAMDRWMVDLTRTGIDFVEYAIDAQPGVARSISARTIPAWRRCPARCSFWKRSRSRDVSCVSACRTVLLRSPPPATTAPSAG